MSNDTTLQKILTLIDNHSEEIPEGDYLDMCNKLRDIYREQQPRRVRTLPNTLRINPMDTIFQRCMVLVRRRKELKKSLYFKSITTYIDHVLVIYNKVMCL